MHIEIHETNMHLLLETATSYMLHVSVSIWLKLLVSLASVICLVLNQPLRRWIAELLLGLIGKRKQ